MLRVTIDRPPDETREQWLARTRERGHRPQLWVQRVFSGQRCRCGSTIDPSVRVSGSRCVALAKSLKDRKSEVRGIFLRR
jgi:hypothetical protein